MTPLSRRITAFTLIELMITVAIIGILAAIAYPSYQSHVMRTHRAAAKACLSEHAQFLERYYTSNLTYLGANPVLSCRTEGNLNQRYTIATTNLAARSYTVTATPIGAQVKDTQCGTLGMDQSGGRTASGTGGEASCW